MSAAELFYRLAGGGLIARNVSGSEAAAPELPVGATRLSKSAYERALVGVQVQRDTHAAEALATDDRNRRGDYEALIALQVPQDTARRLTGYTEETADGHR